MVNEKSGCFSGDWLFWVIMIVAVAFRFILLGIKPPHFDEGINGWFVDQLIANGFYRYDPENYHGPFHFYLLFLFKLFLGRSLFALRFPTAMVGVATVYVLTQFKSYFGRLTSYTAAFLAAVSPAMVFYSRYGIHESELLLFSLLAVLGYMRLQFKRDRVSLWLIGIGLAGAICTKEVFIFHLICFAMAGVCLRIWENFVPSEAPVVQKKKLYTSQDVYAVILVCGFLTILFYSGFFLNMKGIGNLLLSFVAWSKTGVKGNGHEKPFLYWFQLMVRYEWAALAGFLATPILLMRTPRHLRLVGIYGFGAFLAYSLINYKTPWCIIQFLWPFWLIVGHVFQRFGLNNRKTQVVALGACLSFSGMTAFASYDLNFNKYTDEAEPYVYVQTFPEILDVVRIVDDAARSNPSVRYMPINIILVSDWPLPWLLGEYPRAAYFTKSVPEKADASLIVADLSQRKTIETKLTKDYYFKIFRLRSSQEPSIVYFDKMIFKDYFPSDFSVFTAKAREPLKPGEGLLARYYNSPQWLGDPAIEERVATPEFALDDTERPLPAPFGIVYTGEILIPEAGNVQFVIKSDDGADLKIDDKIIISDLEGHAEKEASGTIPLKKGWHGFRLRYFDAGGGMVLSASWRLPSMGSPELIPSSSFRFRGKN